MWTESSTTKIRPDHPVPETLRASVTLHAVRNEWETFQIALAAIDEPVKDIRVAATDLLGPAATAIRPAGIELRRVAYVRVRTPSWAGSRAGLWPDPLPPLKQPFSLHPYDGVQAVWVTVKVGKRLAPGQYVGTLRVTAGETTSHELGVVLNVHDAELPDHSPSCHAWLELNYADILAAHGVNAADGDDAAALTDAYLRFLLERRVTCPVLPVAPKDDAAAPYFDAPRCGLFLLPSADTRSELSASLPAKRYLPQAVLRLPPRRGTETAATWRGRVQELTAMARGAKLLNEAPVGKGYAGADVWCVSPGDADPADLAAARAAGQQVWWRISDSLRPPYPTHLIDDAGAAPRALAWLQALYRVSGIWGGSASTWSAANGGDRRAVDVWDDPETVAGANGADFLLYPGARAGVEGPVPSIRLEMIREGLEDLLSLQLLESRTNRQAASLGVGEYQFGRERVRELVRRVATNATSFRRDARAFEDARQTVLYDLERARGQLPLLVRSEPAEGAPLPYPGDGLRLLGATSPGAEVTVNGQPVTTNAQGVFRAKAFPLPGANEFVVGASLGGASVSTIRRFTVVEDPQLAILESTLAECETAEAPLTEARAVLTALRARSAEGTYTSADGRRAAGLTTEVRRKTTGRLIARIRQATAANGGDGAAAEHLLRVAGALEARRDYTRALRLLRVMEQSPPSSTGAPCVAEAGTFLGKVGFRLSNGLVSATVWRQGGRLIDLRFHGIPLLAHTGLDAVPDNEAPPLSADLGGYEDLDPTDERLALVNWNLVVPEEFPEKVTLVARTVLPSSGLRLERRLTLRRGSPEILLTYRVQNHTKQPCTFSWLSRMSSAIGLRAHGSGGDPRDDRIQSIPTAGEAYDQPALPGPAVQAALPQTGQYLVRDPVFGIEVVVSSDDHPLDVRHVGGGKQGHYWIEHRSADGEPGTEVAPQDLLHFTLRLTPRMSADSMTTPGALAPGGEE